MSPRKKRTRETTENKETYVQHAFILIRSRALWEEERIVLSLVRCSEKIARENTSDRLAEDFNALGRA